MPHFTLRRLAFASLLLWSFGALAEHYSVPLLVPAGTSGEPQGVLRILNGTDESGTVEIYAIDDAGTRSGPATFTLNASAAVQFTATDLASGNATLGLTGGIGTDVGDARLEIETDLSIVPLAFVRAADGTLSAMHDTVRGAAATDGSDGYTYEVPIFNPASDVTQVSRLRLINPGDAAAAVTIGGRDDSGAVATGGDVTLTLAAGGAQTLTAQQLEAGDTAITGRLGAGTGKWRLTVTSDQPLQVVNIVAATAGYWNNLSTTAAPGAAPADLEAFSERFVGNAIVYVTGSNRFTLNAQTGERFTETAEIDGVSTTYMGSYGYSAIGPDAGRLTVAYDDGDVCAANLYFSTHTAGWFASHCTGSDYPAEGTWLGGNWSVEEDEDDGGEVVETTYGVDDALPGVPTSGQFIPAVTSGGSVTATADGTTIALNDGGYFELSDGTRYTCTSADGCTVANGTVTRGIVAGREAGSGEVDRFPSFRNAVNPGAQTYTVGTAIDALTLPEASGGNGTLAYSLSPNVPGLSFNATMRQLTGTPSTAGTYAMTYTVTDEDADTDTLSFTITVNADSSGTATGGECYVSLLVSIGQSCTYPGTTDAFSVNVRGRGSFLTFLAGIRIRINNQTISGRVYDLLAVHQGDGVWRIDRIAGSTVAPATPPTTGGGGMEPQDTSPSFAADAGPGNQTYTVGTAIATLTLPEASGGDGTLTYSLTPSVPELTFDAMTRQLTGTPSTAASYSMTYTVTDEDGDTDTLSFAITVEESDDGDDAGGSGSAVAGDCAADLIVRPGESCRYPGSDERFSVSLTGEMSFLSRSSRVGINLDLSYSDGIRYELLARNSGDGSWVIVGVAESYSARNVPTEDCRPGLVVLAAQGCRYAGTDILFLPSGTGRGARLHHWAPGLSGTLFVVHAPPSGFFSFSYSGVQFAAHRSSDESWTIDRVGDSAPFECEVGMHVGPGGSCVYPGTTKRFSVDRNGRGSFDGRTDARAIRATATGLAFAAEKKGETFWNITTGPVLRSAVPTADTECQVNMRLWEGDACRYPGTNHVFWVRGSNGGFDQIQYEYSMAIDADGVVFRAHTLGATGWIVARVGAVSNSPPPPPTRALVDRPDDFTGPQIHVVYAVASDGEDLQLDRSPSSPQYRRLTYKNDGRVSIHLSFRTIQEWLAGQIGQQFLLDTYRGELDVSFVRLPFTEEEIAADPLSMFDRIESVVRQETRASKALAIVYHGLEAPTVYGGLGELEGDAAWLIMRGFIEVAQFGGEWRWERPDAVDLVMVHEIFHMMGAVPSCASRAAGRSEAEFCSLASHHVSDTRDIMGSNNTATAQIDPDRNDYYGHGYPDCTDISESEYFMPADQGAQAHVYKQGNDRTADLARRGRGDPIPDRLGPGGGGLVRPVSRGPRPADGIGEAGDGRRRVPERGLGDPVPGLARTRLPGRALEGLSAGSPRANRRHRRRRLQCPVWRRQVVPAHLPLLG